MPDLSRADGSSAADPLALTSARLTLRPWCADDVDELLAILVEPEVRRYLCDGEVVSRDFVVQHVNDSTARFAAGSIGLWAGRDGDGVLHGFAGFMPVHDRLEILFGLRSAACGTGLGREMAETIVAYGFAHGLEIIVGSADPPNRASQRLLERLGMRRCGEGAGATGAQLHYELRRADQVVRR